LKARPLDIFSRETIARSSSGILACIAAVTAALMLDIGQFMLSPCAAAWLRLAIAMLFVAPAALVIKIGWRAAGV
jgi:integral membrane sensor domain MASE1